MKLEPVMDALRHYPENNDLVSDVGMMKGKVVRLAEQPPDQKEEAKETLATQLRQIEQGGRDQYESNS